jgi:hypothetical protein
MTAFELQDDLKNELENIFKDFLLHTPFTDDAGNSKLEVPNIFEQDLPIREDDDQVDDPYPFIIVRVESGKMAGELSHEVKIRMVIGVFDESTERQGHKDILNIIQKIYDRFTKNPVLANKYIMKDDEQNPFLWALQDEDSYPYYFGAIETTWATTAIRRESEFT